MMYHELLSGIAIILTLVGFFPYIRSILKGETKPHLFSWLIWGTTTFVVFLAQLTDKGGVGAWPIGLSGIITLYVTWLAWRHKGDTSIRSSDWLFLFFALSSLPLWYLTSDPLWAVVILTLVDLAGFGPTLSKAYRSPFEEHTGFYGIFAVRNVVAAIALENYSLTTLLFPLAIAAACLALILLILFRRLHLRA